MPHNLTRYGVSAFALAAALIANMSDAATLSLREGATDPTFYPAGYAGTEDSSIYYYAAPAGDNRNPNAWMRGAAGGTNGLLYMATGSTTYRTLTRFNLGGMNAALPSGQHVVVTGPATLRFTSFDVVTTATPPTVGLYEIAKENAGWRESTKNAANPGTPSSPTNLTSTIANQDDPTFWYMKVDATLPVNTSGAADTTSTKWFSGQTTLGGVGSNPEGFANTGGLWNPIDLVDQNPATVASDYLSMGNMDPVSSVTWPVSPVGTAAPGQVAMNFTIPAAMIQKWIDNPSENAGLLARAFIPFVAVGQFRMYSSEIGTAGLRPTLTFDYAVVPEPATIGLVVIGAVALVVRRRR